MDKRATTSIKSPTAVPRRFHPARYPARSAREIHSRSRVMDTSQGKVKYRRLNTNQCGNTINTDPFTYAPWLPDAKGVGGPGYRAPPPGPRGTLLRPYRHFSGAPAAADAHQRTEEVFMAVVRSPHFTSTRPVYWPRHVTTRKRALLLIFYRPLARLLARHDYGRGANEFTQVRDSSGDIARHISHLGFRLAFRYYEKEYRKLRCYYLFPSFLPLLLFISLTLRSYFSIVFPFAGG